MIGYLTIFCSFAHKMVDAQTCFYSALTMVDSYLSCTSMNSDEDDYFGSTYHEGSGVYSKDNKLKVSINYVT